MPKAKATEEEIDKPQEGKTYALTGGTGDPSIASGDSWAQSEVKGSSQKKFNEEWDKAVWDAYTTDGGEGDSLPSDTIVKQEGRWAWEDGSVLEDNPYEKLAKKQQQESFNIPPDHRPWELYDDQGALMQMANHWEEGYREERAKAIADKGLTDDTELDWMVDRSGLTRKYVFGENVLKKQGTDKKFDELVSEVFWDIDHELNLNVNQYLAVKNNIPVEDVTGATKKEVREALSVWWKGEGKAKEDTDLIKIAKDKINAMAQNPYYDPEQKYAEWETESENKPVVSIGEEPAESDTTLRDYVSSFYGKGGITDLGFTTEQIDNAIAEYKSMLAEEADRQASGGAPTISPAKDWTWGGGDSVDRERIRNIAMMNIHDENEDKNLHSENAVLLAKAFGTEEERKLMAEVMDRHEKAGSIENKDREWRDLILGKYYADLIFAPASDREGYLREQGKRLEELGALMKERSKNPPVIEKETKAPEEIYVNKDELLQYWNASKMHGEHDKYKRMLWATDAYARKNNIKSTGRIYKALDEMIVAQEVDEQTQERHKYGQQYDKPPTVIQEGKAGATFGSAREDNPYTRDKERYMSAVAKGKQSYDDGWYSKLSEMESDWDSGFSVGLREMKSKAPNISKATSRRKPSSPAKIKTSAPRKKKSLGDRLSGTIKKNVAKQNKVKKYIDSATGTTYSSRRGSTMPKGSRIRKVK